MEKHYKCGVTDYYSPQNLSRLTLKLITMVTRIATESKQFTNRLKRKEIYLVIREYTKLAKELTEETLV